MYILISLLLFHLSSGIDVQKYLTQNGYLNATENALTDMEEGIANFQEFYPLKVTGKENEETLALMNKPRCGMPDYRESFIIHSKWKKRNLTWYYSYASKQRRIIAKTAFELWQNVTNLEFTYTYAKPD